MTFNSEHKKLVAEFLREGLDLIPSALEFDMDVTADVYNEWAKRASEVLNPAETAFVTEIVIATSLLAAGMMIDGSVPLLEGTNEDQIQTG